MRHWVKAACAGLLAISAASPVAAGELGYRLSATVPVRCAVTDIQPIDLQEGTLLVNAMCNAAAFRLVLGGDLSTMPIQAASGTGAAVDIRSNMVVVRPDRPGGFTFTVSYGGDISGIRSAFADIQTF